MDNVEHSSLPAAAMVGEPLQTRSTARVVLLLFLVVAGAMAWFMRTGDSLGGGAAAPLAAVVAALEPEPPVRAMNLDELRREADRRPRDGRAWALRGYAEFESEQFAEAATAYEKAVTVSPKVAADPGVLCDWADALGMVQGGSLKGRPTALVSRALAIRSTHPKALEMAGSAAYERRDFAMAAEYWRKLAPQFAENSPPRRALEDAIARAERLAVSIDKAIDKR